MKKTLHILYYTIISILIPLPCLSVSPQKGNILFIDEFNENSIIPDSSESVFTTNYSSIFYKQ